MASSQALSVAEGSSRTNFPQSGQLDWVALSRLQTTWTWEAAARLCNAGINTVTVIAGTGLCSSFSFPPDGQAELIKSLSRHKGYLSCNKLLWFGLGLKHIIHELCDTERGAACVALSAALAVPYTSIQAARVWRELCVLRGVPHNLIPAAQQWATLVDVCSGCLSHSKFSHYFEQFSLFLVPKDWDSRAPAPAKDIAKALATLADLSNASLHSSTFVGGVECAWLAAVAEYLLRLRIEIQDEEGRLIYNSGNSNDETPIQAFFRREPKNGILLPGPVVQHICFISKGEHLLQERVDFTASMIRNPSNWSNIFSNTFSEWGWRQFTSSTTRSAFNCFMVCLALHSRAYFSSQVPIHQSDFSLWWLQLYPRGCLYHPRRFGDDLIRFARDQFPEILFLDSVESLDSLSPSQSRAKMEASLQQIADACGCSSCKGMPVDRTTGARRLCFKRLALTIIRLILILSPVAVHEHIPPSVTALKQLYNCTIEPTPDSPPIKFPCHGVPLILFLFTGRLPTRNIPEHVSAASAGGICVFLTLLKDLNISPLDATGIEVIPGSISHEDHLYTFVKDMDLLSQELSVSTSRRREGVELCKLAAHHFELVVELQEEDKSTLGASYRAVHSSNQNICICLETLQISLLGFLRTNILCVSECSPIFELEATGRQWLFCELASGNVVEAATNSLSVSNACWSILAWNSWKIPAGEHSQNWGLPALSRASSSIGLVNNPGTEFLTADNGGEGTNDAVSSNE
ncbi:hypothetical protein FGG08_005749 [Glutinoglossum americanum]|uniref:Uncharacterized protein n=1 Tax=Glutinoglossum americanum TaxID=1670608 RepID=A0A9P8I2M5_9PEZI|nr:hypothetical protein FGG08_005749 [Glutinoglossum americanum]